MQTYKRYLIGFELVALIDRILPEYIEIWNYRNFEMGIARSQGYLESSAQSWWH